MASTPDHEPHGRCRSCGNAVHHYPFGWQHVGCGMLSCDNIDPEPACCEVHAPRAAAESEPERRLVNCYPVHDLHWLTPDHAEWRQLAGADGDPDRALRDALAAKADGILIHDVRTGERWFVDCAAVIRYDFARELAFVRASDAWHRERGDVMCWCSRWVATDDLVEGTCGAEQCLRSEALDAAGLVP